MASTIDTYFHCIRAWHICKSYWMGRHIVQFWRGVVAPTLDWTTWITSTAWSTTPWSWSPTPRPPASWSIHAIPGSWSRSIWPRLWPTRSPWVWPWTPGSTLVWFGHVFTLRRQVDNIIWQWIRRFAIFGWFRLFGRVGLSDFQLCIPILHFMQMIVNFIALIYSIKRVQGLLARLCWWSKSLGVGDQFRRPYSDRVFILCKLSSPCHQLLHWIDHRRVGDWLPGPGHALGDGILSVALPQAMFTRWILLP